MVRSGAPSVECRPERDAGLSINQNRHFVGERPGRPQRGRVRIGHVHLKVADIERAVHAMARVE